MNLEQLEGKFRNLPSRYTHLKSLCENKVVRWEWATESIYELRPFYFERHRLRRGRKLKGEPSVKNGKCQYGLDENDHPVVLREYVEFIGSFYEEFFVYGDECIESARFDYSPEKTPINLCRYEYNDHRMISFISYAQYGCSSETYCYERDKISEIKLWHREHGKSPRESLLIIDYDEVGALKYLAEKYPDQETPDVIYQRLDSRYTVRNLCAIVEQKLIRLIPGLIEQANFQTEAYCLVIAYDLESDFPLPPILGLGLELERQSRIKEHGKNAKDYLWNPAEFTHFNEDIFTFHDQELLNACKLLNQELCRKESFNVVRKLLNQVSVQLAQLDWAKVIPITTDFVVFAVDLEGADLIKNLKVSASSEKLNALKSRGLL